MENENSFSISDLVKIQTDRFDALKQIYINYKKDATSRKTKQYFQLRLEKLNEIHSEFSATHKIILCSTEKNEEYFTSKISYEFDEKYFNILCAITEAFEQLHPVSTVKSMTSHDQSPSGLNQNTTLVKLPNLPVPTFTGKFIDWPGFHDTFNRLIHLNPDLNAIQKFHFLRKALPTDRDVDIHQMPLTEDNYLSTWQLLLKRYNNPRILFMHYMNTLFNLPLLIHERSEEIKSLLNVANLCVNAFRRLGIPIDNCDHWMAHYLSTKLPKDTHRAWELSLGSKVDIPTFAQLSDFLNSRLFTLDAIENRNITNQIQSSSYSEQHKSSHPSSSKLKKKSSTHDSKCFHITAQGTNHVEHCALCSQNHILRRCPTFLAKDCYERKTIVDNAKLCLNCLTKSHTVSKCTSTKNCLVANCGQRHHTLLHFPKISTKTTTSNNSKEQVADPVRNNQNDGGPVVSINAAQSLSTATSDNRSYKVLLATAIVTVINQDTGHNTSLRALIDQGSEGTIISEHAVQTLGLKRRQISAQIAGVGPDAINQCKYSVSFIMRSTVNTSFSLFVETAFVLNKLTSSVPSTEIMPHQWPHIQGLTLADPTYYKSLKIDLILGADLLAEIFLPETKLGSSDQPIVQNTRLGWILSGRVATSAINTNSVTIRCHQANIELDTLVQHFFELDQVPKQRVLSLEDQWCEDFFKRTHSRQSNGKYMVRLPLKSLYDPQQTLGKSRQISLNRFHCIERRLNQNNAIRDRYHAAIEEYFNLNQIVEATTTEEQHCAQNEANHIVVTSCVLAHHAVIKEDSLTTKVRIVFDASAKTSNGRSLNDVLCVGPPLQNDLPAVILNWRMHQYVFVADIQKMYRCIGMNSEDAQYQRILWRNSKGNIQEYCLTTVTFGTASAPYTAIKVMHQLADDEKLRFPLAERVLKHEMYVDDVLTGSHSIVTAIEMRDQLIGALLSAGMELRKWSSNSPQLLESIPIEHHSTNPLLDISSIDMVKTLGMYWQPTLDEFRYKLNFEINTTATKRAVLSTVARLFDPLGLINPVVVTAKILLKQIHAVTITRENKTTTSLTWDEIIPESINTQWQQFLTSLPDLEKITIPRWTCFRSNAIKSIELHAFSDGSSSTYAASVYIRITHTDNNEIYTRLLVSKTKVTPTKPITIPEIELCGALLATTLIAWVQNNIRLPHHSIKTYFWTDATIVLYWINGDVNRWKVFVANRISLIQQQSSAKQWGHVGTNDNPADCATRGLTPSQLATFDLWWNGPSWLREPIERWPKFSLANCVIDESLTHAKPTRIQTHFAIQQDSVIYKYSSLNKLLRVTAIIFRFYNNCLQKSKEKKITGPITVNELQRSLKIIVLLVQKEVFSADMYFIKSNQPLPNKSKLVSLTPFFDDDQILRVRGRLQRTNWPYARKHPMILPNDHPFTELVINNSHANTLHGGIKLTLSHLLHKFWIVKGYQTVQRILRKCLKCVRNNPTNTTQLLGNLPYQRVNPPKRAFLATGVDYTGAIELKSSKYRGNTTSKGYIVIFICLASKAIHLEAVTGMSTECFLMALQRFIGRRGICHDMYSDCGTNFIGADNVLKNNTKKFIEEVERDIVPKLAAQSIQWHFNPPHSPNFGGIWEANVKSVKYHLKRTVEGNRQTYEELSTVLTRIEACLNSRPLCPLRADPDDLDVLTPGHFLIGDALLCPSEAPNAKVGLSQQYLTIQKMVQHFWSKWSSDWLSHLQARPKWRHEEQNLKLNELVLIKDDRLPPNQWLLGRIIELHPGNDNLVRVVTLRTKNGAYKRSVSKICRLPIPTYTEETEPSDDN